LVPLISPKAFPSRKISSEIVSKGLAVWDRPDLARRMDKRSSGAAAALRQAPPDGLPVTIVVATLDGVQIFHHPIPGAV